jgi:hypothetical protein
MIGSASTGNPECTSQTVIKSTLRCSNLLYTIIGDLVQATSEMEARGSAVFNLAVFKTFEQEGELPKEIFEQGFVTACMRSVSTSKETVYRPSAICLKYLLEARNNVPEVPDFDFKRLGQTMNQLGRRYLTVIKTSFTRHILAHQIKAVRTQVQHKYPELATKKKKSLCAFITKDLVWQINCVDGMYRPDAKRYSDPETLTTGHMIIKSTFSTDLVKEHKNNYKTSGLTLDVYNGYLSPENVGGNLHLFFGYMVFLFNTLKSFMPVEGGKLPFQIIPQLRMKCRSITIGKEQMAEIMMRLVESGQQDDGTIDFPFELDHCRTAQ